MTTTSMEDGVLETASGRRIGWQLLGPPDGEVVAYLTAEATATPTRSASTATTPPATC